MKLQLSTIHEPLLISMVDLSKVSFNAPYLILLPGLYSWVCLLNTLVILEVKLDHKTVAQAYALVLEILYIPLFSNWNATLGQCLINVSLLYVCLIAFGVPPILQLLTFITTFETSNTEVFKFTKSLAGL